MNDSLEMTAGSSHAYCEEASTHLRKTLENHKILQNQLSQTPNKTHVLDKQEIYTSKIKHLH
jgi:hypothetical protein